jgi:hypothetical protein
VDLAGRADDRLREFLVQKLATAGLMGGVVHRGRIQPEMAQMAQTWILSSRDLYLCDP